MKNPKLAETKPPLHIRRNISVNQIPKHPLNAPIARAVALNFSLRGLTTWYSLSLFKFM